VKEIHVYPNGGLQVIELGRQGESQQRVIVFHLDGWPRGTVYLLHRRRADSAPYPCALEREGNVARWLVTAVDTAQAGSGCAQLRVIREGTVVKSRILFTSVAQDLAASAPDPGQTPTREWLDAMLSAAARAEQAAEHPPVIRDGTWWVWDGGAYADTGAEAEGCRCDESTATDEEFGEMLDDVFDGTGGGSAGPGDDTATDQEFNEMLEDVFG